MINMSTTILLSIFCLINTGYIIYAVAWGERIIRNAGKNNYRGSIIELTNKKMNDPWPYCLSILYDLGVTEVTLRGKSYDFIVNYMSNNSNSFRSTTNAGTYSRYFEFQFGSKKILINRKYND